MSHKHEIEQSLHGSASADTLIPDTKGLRRFVVALGPVYTEESLQHMFTALNELSHRDLMACKLAAQLDSYGPSAEFSLAPDPSEREARERLKDPKLSKSERARLEHQLDDRSDPEHMRLIADPGTGHPELLLHTHELMGDPEKERLHGAGFWHSMKKAARKAAKTVKHAVHKANKLRKDIGHATEKLRHNAVTKAYSKFLNIGDKVIGTAARFIPDPRLQAAADVIGVANASVGEIVKK
jgi:hypothetical protein